MIERLLGQADTAAHPRMRAVAVGLLWFLIVAGIAVASERPVPVMLGGDLDFDACQVIGAVKGLDPRGDGFLAVRAGPEAHYKMLDQLNNGQLLYICDSKGDWLGVVYDADPERDCGVGTPWAEREPYTGPCKSGWVHGRYVEELAG
jgi:hypothetical protein